MAFPAFFSVIGSKQGQFKGETVEARRRDKWMTVLSFSMDLESPHDAATGQLSGKRQWRPIKVVKEWGAASPQGLAACATNEILREVVFEFTKTNPNGEEYVYQTIKLTNAMIAGVVRFTGHPGAGGDGLTQGSAPWADTHELDQWSITFRQIEVVDHDANTTFLDDWGSGD